MTTINICNVSACIFRQKFNVKEVKNYDEIFTKYKIISKLKISLYFIKLLVTLEATAQNNIA